MPMRLIRLITIPYLRRHKLRAVLTIIGVVIGVALVVSMRAANRSVLAAFKQTVARIAGKAQLQVTAGDTGFPEEVLEKVQSLREVGAAAPVIEATVSTGEGGKERLLILAVDKIGRAHV